MKKKFRSFEDAREFARKLHLRSGIEWKKLGKNNTLPKDIPHDPAKSYKEEWKNWKDWLGYDKRYQKKGEFKTFQDAKKFVHSLNLKNQIEWRQYTKSGKRPKDIPSLPSRTYAKDWINFGDWLGTGRIHPKYIKFKNFDDAHKFVITLKLKTIQDWKQYVKSDSKPKDIPSNANHIYKEKWISWEHWLTGKNIAPRGKRLLGFEEAKVFARNLKLIGKKQWEQYIKSGKRPDYIPAAPDGAYKNKGWISWNDWLGDGNIDPRSVNFKTYEEAKKIVKTFGVQYQADWAKFAKTKQKPIDIPANPRQYYKKEWKGWGDFLGTGRISVQTKSKNWPSFQDAKGEVRILAKKYNIKTWSDWNKAIKNGLIPNHIPRQPNQVYSKKRKR